jgi:molybdopterin synthase sulfur carrier subunit
MTVAVRIPTILRRYTDGAQVVQAEGNTIKDVFVFLEDHYPGIGTRLIDTHGGVHRFVNVFVGDDDVRYLEGLDTPIREGDEVTIIPAVSGGC